MRTLIVATLAVACLVLVGCKSSGLGKLSPKLVEMYDRGKPDGWMEIEAERDGTILGIETDIAISDLPDAIREAALAELPGARITGAEWEMIGKQEGYEVKLNKSGREYELVYSTSGELIEKESTLRRGEEPDGVLQAAMGSVPGGTFKSVERIDRGESTFYHVKLLRSGASYKVELDENATVLRAVREAKAEIEIPLR